MDNPHGYPKLVRDGILEIIRNAGLTPYFHIATGSELEDALMQKLKEEVNEFYTADGPKESVKELADVIEVVYAIADFYKVKHHQLKKGMLNDETRYGSMDKKVLLKKLNDAVDEVHAEPTSSEALDMLRKVFHSAYAMANHYGFSHDELEQIRQKKAQERGTFSQGIIVERVE